MYRRPAHVVFALLLAAVTSGCGGGGDEAPTPMNDGAAPTMDQGLDAYQSGDFEGARSVFQSLADQGDAEGEFGLGNLYMNGQGVAQDLSEALRLFESAGEKGHVDAQYASGFMWMSRGRDPLADADEALKWWSMAAEQGHVQSIYEIGWRMCYGLYLGPLEDDCVEGRRLLRQAAAEGHAPAQARLADAYRDGRGGQGADPQHAYMWYTIALEQTGSYLLQDPEEVRSKRSALPLTQAEIATATALASRCRESGFQECS